MAAERLVYLNAAMVPEADARISLFDSQNIWGDMVFETTRTFGHQPFKLREHLDRLYASLAMTRIDCGLSIDEMERATLELLERNRPAYASEVDFNIVHNVSRGPIPQYADAFDGGIGPTVAIFTWPLIKNLGPVAQYYESGVHAVTPRQRSIPARLLDPKVKSRARLHYQMAQLEMADFGPDAWAVLLDEDGYLTEGTGSNFFLVRDGELLTPEPRNVLRGVTRQTVLDLAAELHIPAQAANIEPYDAISADEAFFTSTPFCLMPATRFNGRPVGDGRVGPVFRRLTDAFAESAGVDFIEQAKGYSATLGLA